MKAFSESGSDIVTVVMAGFPDAWLIRTTNIK
jgi:hypothetical protein